MTTRAFDEDVEAMFASGPYDPRAPRRRRRRGIGPHWYAIGLLAVLLIVSGFTHAAGINYVGKIGRKAIISVDGGAPRVYAPGDRLPWGATLVAVNGDVIEIEAAGERLLLKMGSHVASPRSGSAFEAAKVALKADASGRYPTEANVNGANLRVVVDPKASMVTLPADDAKRLGIDYSKGRPAVLATGEGDLSGYLVRVDTIRVGAVAAHGVDAVIVEQGRTQRVLGKSFLDRTSMRVEGDSMTLTRRF